MPTTTKPTPSWRDMLPVHDAANLFPLLPPDELRALGKDIVEHGLASPIALWRATPQAQAQLVDGRSRLDGLEMAAGPVVVGPPSIMVEGKDFLALDKVIILDGRKVDPYAYVISANIHRRHLTAEQKRDLIAKLLKATPEKSDRQIAETVKASPTTVGTVRAEMESTVQIGQLPKRIGKDGKGRKQPKRATAKSKQTPASRAQQQVAPPHDDIGPASTGEIERLRARNQELENKVRRLEIENAGLRSEVEELRSEKAKSASQPVADVIDPPPADAGLDIPECLRRSAP